MDANPELDALVGVTSVLRSTIAHWINGAVHRIDDAAEFNAAAASVRLTTGL
jgi:hypothetical protein